MTVFVRALSVLMSVLLIPFYGLTYGIDAISLNTRCEDDHTNIVGIGAYFRSQGAACDGEYLYFSSKTTMLKTEKNGREFVDINLSAIPDELSELGIKHIGGISYYDGLIYAGMEDSKVWDHPIVGVFSPETLELVKYYELDPEVHTRGLPWVAVDSDTGLLCAFDHSKTPGKILFYDVKDDMKPAGETALPETIKSIQGGEFYKGYLYVATNDDTQAVYRVNTADGSFEKMFDRGLTSGSEGEGMTFVEKDNILYLMAFDMGPLFINSNIRWYKVA